jgi:hypothetical protein
VQSPRPAVDRDHSLALHDVDQGVVGDGVLTQFLPGVEGEEGDVAGLSLEDDPADDRQLAPVAARRSGPRRA